MVVLNDIVLFLKQESGSRAQGSKAQRLKARRLKARRLKARRLEGSSFFMKAFGERRVGNS